MLQDKRRYIVCLREGRIGAKHVFVSVAAVSYVTGGAVHVRVLCTGGVLSIVSYIRIAERMYVCGYIRTNPTYSNSDLLYSLVSNLETRPGCNNQNDTNVTLL